MTVGVKEEAGATTDNSSQHMVYVSLVLHIKANKSI